jgi:DNA-3-methyladenine glycosylase
MTPTDPLPLARLIRESRIVPREFYARPTAEVARALLGKVIVHQGTAGRIVETEAYLGLDDLAAHASRGVTGRTRVLFGPPGYAYVYFIYGMYECLNFVADEAGRAGCVLIRAVEPLAGIRLMQRRRPRAARLADLASGPGKLTQALGVTRRLYGADLTRGALTVRALRAEPPFETVVTTRVNVHDCADWPLRFVVAGSPFLSR